MELYAAFDLHASKSFLGVIDEQGRRVFKKKVYNDRELVLDILRPRKEEIVGIVVESTQCFDYKFYVT